jgi:tRNA (guanosine-2'-O-)-methyltransferase
MERVIACLEPLVTPERRARMQSVLARRSDHVAFVFERMVDPHNLSAVLRSLDALSFQDAHLIDPQERIELARGITIGAERWLTLHDHSATAPCLAALREGGYRVLASRVAGRGATSLTELDFRERTALVFGNEHLGVSDEVAELADGAFHIEMLGFAESFNLSVAAALCAFHARRELERLMAADPEPGRFLLPEPRRREIYAGWLRRSIKRSEQILAETGEG